MILSKINPSLLFYPHQSITNQYQQKLCLFSTQTSNIRVPLVHPVSHKLTDEYIYKYQNKMFSGYLKKRRIPRTHIYPKIHIIDNIPKSEQCHLKYQKLFPLKKTLDDLTIKRIIKQDPTQINSAYIMSLFIQQDGFKQMVDQYVGKVLVNGKAPGGLNSQCLTISEEDSFKMEEIQDKVIDLYNVYYFGQSLTPLEKTIQFFYLVSKQQKSMKKQMFPKNAYYRCVWRPQDQRLIEQMVNWPEIDMNLSDLNNRPYFQPLRTSQKLPFAKKLHHLMGGDNFLANIFFQFKVKPDYVYSYNYLNQISQKLISRLLMYIKSIEFTHMMNIPPDFTIQLSILQIHVWMLLDRLKQFKTKQTKSLVKFIEKAHKAYIESLLSSLNLKKVVSTQKKFNDTSELISQTLSMHFNVYQNSKSNPYSNIDALVWSLAFREKVQRYGEEVYKFSEYLVKNHKLMQSYTQEDFINANIQFDVFLGDPDYQSNITQLNPPMNQKQFEEQFNNDKEDKSYYYKIHQKDETIKINHEAADKDTSYSFFNALVDKTIHFMKKYLFNSKNYDHFSEMDQQEKKRLNDQKRSAWKTGSDKLIEVEQEFKNLSKLRSGRRKNR